jgi:GNAT superfamily N-acetyltransferase
MVTVREATAADADAIGRIHAETWRAAYAGVFPDAAFEVERRQRWWRQWLRQPLQPPAATLVAEDEGVVVGFAGVGRSRDEPALGELYTIYVDPNRWSTGAGRALIEAAEDALRKHGFSEAMLWVLEGNERAERFYRRAGWEQDDGRKTELLEGAELTEVRYRKPL